MIRFSDVSYSYPSSDTASLEGVQFGLTPGELVIVTGRSGGGKSTLLRCTNGLIPHFYGGRLSGQVSVDGVSTAETLPRSLADRVGFIGQNPEDHGVVEIVEDDIAFTLENLGMHPNKMRKRVEESLDALGITKLRTRRLDSLSGGERQKAAIASVLAAMPSYLVLDEPTSQLDPQSAEEVVSALLTLRDELGLGIILAEHRLERVVQYADKMSLVEGGQVTNGIPQEMLLLTRSGPPIVQLGRTLGWDPLPLTLREARRRGMDMNLGPVPIRSNRSPGDVVAEARSLSVGIGGVSVLRDLDIQVKEGDVVAVMGRNGSGKTTLLRALAGLIKPSKGKIVAPDNVAFVPQNPAQILFRRTVFDEIAATIRGRGRRSDRASIDSEAKAFGISDLLHRNPLDLSGGQRTKAAIAAACAGTPNLFVLDEPTRGMDEESKEHLELLISSWARSGKAIAIATHDVELAARVATRVVILAEGEIVLDASPLEALSGSLNFSTQMNKVFPDTNILTLQQAIGAIRP